MKIQVDLQTNLLHFIDLFGGSVDVNIEAGIMNDNNIQEVGLTSSQP